MPRNNGPIEQISMPQMVDTSAFRQFIDLENNSKYYMMLLNVREAELERLTKAYEDVQVTLKCCLTTNSKLKDRIKLLEEMSTVSANKHQKEIESYKKQINNNSKNIADVKLDNEERFRELESEYKREILENEKNYVDKLNKQEMEFDKKYNEIMVKYQREVVLNSKLKNDLQTLMNVNVVLKSKVHQVQSKHSVETSSLESEVSLLKDYNDIIKGDVAILKSRLDGVLDENEKLKHIVIECRDEIKQDSIRFEQFKRTNNKLNHELNLCKKRNKRIKFKFEDEVMAKANMKNEIEKLKILVNANQAHEQCNIPEHDNFNNIKRQNEVLQKLVKNMRRERNSRESEDLRQAEDRIEKLEDTIENFKRTDLFGYVSMHNQGA
ncbi:putative autophagy-related protein 11 [Onthophagus taurus]|uniref:putative autophagy-related protein 11 n=1 Tax=Onthophagus taurus TaxID=166361 RepID=UPI000C20C479|nr:spindle pole body component 110-like [Onthophagus taurus]